MDDFSRAGNIALYKENFEPLLYSARKAAYTLSNIRSAWRKAGLVPFNRRLLLDKVKTPEAPSEERTP